LIWWGIQIQNVNGNRKFADKPTHSQSTRGLINLWTGQLVVKSTHQSV